MWGNSAVELIPAWDTSSPGGLNSRSRPRRHSRNGNSNNTRPGEKVLQTTTKLRVSDSRPQGLTHIRGCSPGISHWLLPLCLQSQEATHKKQSLPRPGSNYNKNNVGHHAKPCTTGMKSGEKREKGRPGSGIN